MRQGFGSFHDLACLPCPAVGPFDGHIHTALESQTKTINVGTETLTKIDQIFTTRIDFAFWQWTLLFWKQCSSLWNSALTGHKLSKKLFSLHWSIICWLGLGIPAKITSIQMIPPSVHQSIKAILRKVRQISHVQLGSVRSTLQLLVVREVQTANCNFVVAYWY